MELLWLKVSAWEKRDGLLHGFLGRRGGKSTGPYASLNLSFRVGDDPQVVKDNICDVKRAVGVHDLRIVTMRQMHGDHILEVWDKSLKEAGEADGMITEEKGFFLGVLTADCVPILFSVSGRTLVAVVHAGWRGTLSGIAPKMMVYLKDRYGVEPSSVEVALGPAIGGCCYEIGADVSVPLGQRWGSLAERCLQTRAGRKFCDLRNLNALLLEKAGVPPTRIFKIGPCTSCTSDDFFSYRRDLSAACLSETARSQVAQAGREETGRQLSFIGWLS